MEHREVRVRGVLISRQRELLRRIAGAQYTAALSRVPATACEEYESASILSWCGQGAARAVTAAVAVELGRDPIELVRHVVEISTREALRGPWAILLGRMTDLHAIVRRASVVFEKAFDRGTLRATLVDKEVSRVTLEGWPDPHPMDVESIACGIETMLGVLERPCTVISVRRGAVIEYTIRLRSARPV